MKKTTLMIALSATIFGCAHGSPVQWETDMERAKACAEEEDKDILVYVTGSDWCLPCRLLHEHLFVNRDFLKNLNKRYILLLVDFPCTVEVSQERSTANVALAEHYNVRALPEILLLTKRGVLFGRMGFEGIAPETYEAGIEKFERSRSSCR